MPSYFFTRRLFLFFETLRPTLCFVFIMFRAKKFPHCLSLYGTALGALTIFDLLHFRTFCYLCIQNSQHYAALEWHLSSIWPMFLSYFSCLSSGLYGPVCLCPESVKPDFGFGYLPIALWISRLPPLYNGSFGWFTPWGEYILIGHHFE